MQKKFKSLESCENTFCEHFVSDNSCYGKKDKDCMWRLNCYLSGLIDLSTAYID